MNGNHEKIEALISQTQDPVVQATLLVLSKIDYALDSNTEATQEIAKELSEHREDFRKHALEDTKRLAGLKGAWWAGVALIGAINLLGGYLLQAHVTQNTAQDTAISDLKSRLLIIETQHGITHPPTQNNGIRQ